jgi:methionine biosynthesis protein MetW
MMKLYWLHRNYDIIRSLVDEDSTVLDLGCGDGSFLRDLRRDKNVRGTGIEIDEEHLIKCVGNGIPVIAGDIDRGLRQFKDRTFDYVVLNQTLQVIRKPEFVLEEMMRVGKRAIIGFPNFGYYKIRLSLLFRGRMPVTRTLPHEWHDSPNIHLFTIADFKDFCMKKGFRILDSFYLRENRADGIINAFPNLLASEAVFLIRK